MYSERRSRNVLEYCSTLLKKHTSNELVETAGSTSGGFGRFRGALKSVNQGA